LIFPFSVFQRRKRGRKRKLESRNSRIPRLAVCGLICVKELPDGAKMVRSQCTDKGEKHNFAGVKAIASSLQTERNLHRPQAPRTIICTRNKPCGRGKSSVPHYFASA